MNKRNLASILWFFAGWSGGGLAFGLMGLPAGLALVPAIMLAVLIRLDAAKPLWTHSGSGRRIVPINDFATELEQRGEQRAGAGAKTRRI
ncbi:MAG TPA: hypothetical protein VE011_12620 [Candidatus Dormibacteraeota bacterium]|nr:hypothetical protein [Candidatus Dormibacteraeota bacterium]